MSGSSRAVAVLLFLAVAAGCGDGGGADGPTGSGPRGSGTGGAFVGTVEGSADYVAVVVDTEGDALAFVGDGMLGGEDTLFGGVGDDGSARLSNDGGAVLELTIDGDRASGTFIRPGSETRRVDAETAEPPAGLYRALASFPDGDYQASWVVLPDGRQHGFVQRYETPLPPGSVDASTFEPGDETFTVPGGTLRPRRVEPSDDL